jgi:hypothetical protein
MQSQAKSGRPQWRGTAGKPSGNVIAKRLIVRTLPKAPNGAFHCIFCSAKFSLTLMVQRTISWSEPLGNVHR